MVNEKRIVEEFMELVQIDSETKFEGKIVKVLLEKLKDLGLEAFEDETAAITKHEAGNIIAFMKGNVEGADMIMFNAHMDTVTPGVGIKPGIKDGYIVSDGTTILAGDDKAGIASLLEAIRVLKEDSLQHGDIQFIITAGEESGLAGAKALDSKHLKAKYGFSIDTGGKVGLIITQAPARYSVTADIHGKSAHAGVAPETGISAIMIAAKAIANMPHGRVDSETTANIGVIEGKSPLNVVCDHVRVEAEARSSDSGKLQAVTKAMTDAFVNAAEEMGGKAEVRTEIFYNGFQLAEDAPVVDIAKRAAVKIGRPYKIASGGGGSDGNIFNGRGVPTIVLACGYEACHTKNERLSIDELVKSAEMVLAIVSEAAKTPR